MGGNVAITEKLARFYNFLANMGLVLRDDPPKVIDMAGREWGETVDGLALSVREIRGENSQQPVVLSVVIRNTGSEEKKIIVPGWLFFYEVQSHLPVSAYGRKLLGSERKTEGFEVTLRPGDARETDLPLGALYDIQGRGNHPVRVSSRLPDGTALVSNEIVV
jgi:hypothetical protein